MQEIQDFEGEIRMIGDDAGDRRMNLNHRNLNCQLLKCPRCDSINTKFCYYNNYNFSQPRHFCKSCRRYWTKGGVLRTVPVGGGSRKAKRSNRKCSPGKSEPVVIQRNLDSHSGSDCESSSPTDITGTTVIAQTINLHFQTAESPEKCSDGELFSDIRIFSELVPNGLTDFAGVTPFQLSQQVIHLDPNDDQAQLNLWHPQNKIAIADEDELKMPEMRAGFLDRTVEIDLPPLQSRTNVDLRSFDYREFGRPDMFDIPGATERNYWNDPPQSLPFVNSLSYDPFFNS